MKTEVKTRVMTIVRWAWGTVLALFTLVGLALTPASGLLTLPFALTTGGLALWLLRGGPQQQPGRAAQWLVGVGMAGTVVWLVLLLVK